MDRATVTSPVGFWEVSVKLKVAGTGCHHIDSAWLHQLLANQTQASHVMGGAEASLAS